MANEGITPSKSVQINSMRMFAAISAATGTFFSGPSRIGAMTNLATTPPIGRSSGTLERAVMPSLLGCVSMAARWSAIGPMPSKRRGLPSIMAPR